MKLREFLEDYGWALVWLALLGVLLAAAVVAGITLWQP